MNPGGAQAEDRALRFLVGHGLNVKERNYRCRLGEIDLILLEGKTLVFVEVCMRRQSVARWRRASCKRRCLLATARHYLSQQRGTSACGFDAVLIEHDDTLEWIKDALSE
jgi:putative endonuclease